MNLFLDYKKKILVILNKIEKKGEIKTSKNLKNITIDLPPKNQKGDISCNAAMILAGVNNISPIQMAETLKNHLFHIKNKFS